MKGNSTIQSLDRGLAILELLGKHKRMTASAVGKELGIHQSSASRLLNSLVQSGFVYKPEFQSFALDYGVLLFAGKTLACFPLVEKATAACNKIVKQYGYSANVGVLFRDRLVYLTTCTQDSSITLIDNDKFPIFMSSVGRMLAYRQGKEKALEIINKSLARHPASSESGDGIYEEVDASINEYGFLYMKNRYFNKFNASQYFEFDKKIACLAVYSETDTGPSPLALSSILNDAIKQIQKEVD